MNTVAGLLRTRWPQLAIAVMFAVYGSLSVLLLATITPPFMNPDEGAHFARADQVAHGGLVAHGDPAAPALIDAGVLAESRRFYVLVASPGQRVPRALYAPADWGPRLRQGSPNSALYPPTLYLPAALAIRIGQSAGLTVLPTLELARGMTGLASVVIGTVAIALAGPAAIWLFAILTLPMTLAQMAAMSQDGPMIALAALATAAFLRSLTPQAPRQPVWLATACMCLALIGMSRPPYAALALVPLLVPGAARAWRWAGAAFVVLMVAGWSAVSLAQSRVDLLHFAKSGAREQAAGLLWAPWRVAPIAWNTLATYGQGYLEQFVGRLGWLDTALPGAYRLAAAGVLVLAAASAWRAGLGAWSGRRALALGGAVMAAGVMMFGLQYLTWTPVGAALVEGVQGRYFLPLALILGGVFIRPVASGSRVAALAACAVALFPLASIVVMLHAVLLRYYL